MQRQAQKRQWIVVGLVVVAHVASAAARSEEPRAGGEAPAWTPPLYGFCLELPALPDPPVSQQCQLLREIGYDGVGYPLWLDQQLDENLRRIDEAGIELYLVYTTIDVRPGQTAFDPRLPDAIRRLKGRPVTVSVLLTGLPPGDPQGTETAVRVLRQLGDVAAESDVHISIYHHVDNWTESLPYALQIVQQTQHPRVGVNFNLCHWLKVEGQADYRPLLRQHAEKILAVTINGATCGAESRTNGLIQPLDRGDFDNRALLATLREVGYRGPVGLMCYGIPDATREHLQRSLDVWKTWQAAGARRKDAASNP